MGGALVKGEQGAAVEGRVLEDGRVVPPPPAQQALNMAGLDIYTWDPTSPHSDDEPLSDLEWGGALHNCWHLDSLDIHI